MSRIAAFFDLDKTIIATSSAAAFTRPFFAGGLLSHGDVLRSAYAHFLFMVGGADADQTERMRTNLSGLVTGWSVDTVSQIVAETIREYIDPYVYAEAVALIEEHRAAGHDVVIVSASGAELVEPIAKLLGADGAVSTRMTVEDGKYTGQIDFYAYGENKATAIRALAEEHGYDLASCYAYSDSITDAPMLAAVGHGFAVNPDRALRRLSAEEGWEVLMFARPISMRRHLRPHLPAVIAVTAVAAAVVGWAAWNAARRHDARRDVTSGTRGPVAPRRPKG